LTADSLTHDNLDNVNRGKSKHGLESLQLNGKNALVTGSSRGLGAAIAIALAPSRSQRLAVTADAPAVKALANKFVSWEGSLSIWRAL